jgi:transposase
MIPNPCIEVQTSPLDRPSVPAWFAEVVMIAHHLASKGLVEAFAQQVRLVRGRFGSYEPNDFLGLLIGYAISGERTLADFFERLEPFESAFMALFGRQCLPHRSSLSRFLSDVDRPCLEAFRTLFEQQSFAEGWTAETIGGIFDRQGRRYIVFDVDATRQAARQRALPTDPILPEMLAAFERPRGFRHLPRRWVVERTLAWIGRYRRMSKDYEYMTSSSEAMVYLTMLRLMLTRLAKQNQKQFVKYKETHAA